MDTVDIPFAAAGSGRYTTLYIYQEHEQEETGVLSYLH